MNVNREDQARLDKVLSKFKKDEDCTNEWDYYYVLGYSWIDYSSSLNKFSLGLLNGKTISLNTVESLIADLERCNDNEKEEVN